MPKIDTTKKTRTTKQPGNAKKDKETRKVLYSSYETELCVGKNAVNSTKCEELLGWCEDEATAREAGFDAPTLYYRDGKPIWLLNNLINRPFYPGTSETYVQKIFHRRWRFNGEPIIIGEYGSVLNGQHQMVAVKLAEWDRLNDETGAWERNWPKPIEIEKLIIYGVKETDDVVDTMDTCRPRSLADVIYRSEYFRDYTTSNRKIVSKVLEHAVRFLWARTGAGIAAYSNYKTHEDMCDLVNRHPRLLETVKLVHKGYSKNNRWKECNRRLSAGYAAGMFYLMGCCLSDPVKYTTVCPPTEKVLNWKHWNTAKSFWSNMWAEVDQCEFPEVLTAISMLSDPVSGSTGSLREKTAVIIKAWHAYLAKGEATLEDCKLSYLTDDFGISHLHDDPSIGGIDLGDPKAKGIPLEAEAALPAQTPTREELEDIRREIEEETAKPARPGKSKK